MRERELSELKARLIIGVTLVLFGAFGFVSLRKDVKKLEKEIRTKSENTVGQQK